MSRRTVHRNLEFGPGHHSGGPDVTELKRATARELVHRHLGFLVNFKSAQRAPHTIARAIFALGLSERVRKAALAGHVGKWTQRKIRNPQLRSPLDRIRERRRRPELRKWREEHRHAGVTAMFDSIDLDQIPDDAPAVAGYTGGSWPTFSALPGRFPNARRLSIAVRSSDDAECLDVEPGDATPADAPRWVKRQLARGVRRPVVYGSVSQMGEILAALARAGIPRSAVRVWTAHYTFSPHICGPHSCGELSGTEADATQWTNSALGRNLDESQLRPGFFG